MPKAYTSDAGEALPSDRVSGAMWVTVPLASELSAVFVALSATSLLSPKSDTLAVKPRASLCQGHSNRSAVWLCCLTFNSRPDPGLI